MGWYGEPWKNSALNIKYLHYLR